MLYPLSHASTYDYNEWVWQSTIVIMFIVGDYLMFYARVYKYAQMFWDTIVNLQGLKMSKRTRTCVVCICVSVLSSILRKGRRLVPAKAFFVYAGPCTRVFFFFFFFFFFLESICKESHAHANFGYFSIFIGPITVAHDGSTLAICIGPYSLAHCRANKKWRYK